jgi:hypothetical protein
MEHFGNTLRKVLKEKMVTHKYMSDRLGIKPQRFYQITKMADVKLKTAVTILDVIDMSVQEFLDYGKQPEPVREPEPDEGQPTSYEEYQDLHGGDDTPEIEYL